MCFEYGVHRHPRHPLSENPLWAFRPCTPHPQPRVLVITGLWELADLLATVLLPDTAAFPGAEGTVAWSIGSPPEICDALNKTVTLSFSGQTELIHYMQTDRKVCYERWIHQIMQAEKFCDLSCASQRPRKCYRFKG